MTKNNPVSIAKKKIEREEKTTPVYLIKANDELGQVEAIVSVFGVIDMANDIIHPGSYVKTITERAGKIRVLDNHRTDSTLAAVGKPLQMRELKREELPPKLLEEYPEATGGLWTLTQFDMETPEGKGVYARLKNGTINEWSIGFDVLDWDKEKVMVDGKSMLIRNIRTIRLWEYSAVLWGANQATNTVAVKELDMKDSPPNYMTLPDPAQHDACKNCYFKDGTDHCVKYAVQVEDSMICDSYQPRNEKAGDVAEQKMPEDETGKTISAELMGAAYDVFSMYIAGYVKRGVITPEEFIVLVTVGAQLVDFVKTSIPAELADRECEDDFGMLYWAHDGATDVKAVANAIERKAGRVLSQANYDKLSQALAQIQEVLGSAAVADTEDVQAESSKGASIAEQAGSQKAPTFQEELNALIQLQQKLKGDE